MKLNVFGAAMCAAIVVGGCTRATPEQQVIDDAAAALGGRDRILAAKTLVIEGNGENGNLGQDLTPERTVQTFTVSTYRREIDLAGGRTRVERTRTPTFPYFQGQQPQTQVFGVAGEVGYDVAPDGKATRAANAVARDRRVELFHHPLTVVRAALDPGATLANPRTANGQKVVDVTTGGLTFTLALDAATNLPSRVVSMADNLNLGDVAVETAFADYQDVGGLKLPARLTTTTDRVMTTDIHATRQTLDGPTSDLAAPAAAATAAPIAGLSPANVTVQEIAKGIWWLAGQSHHSVLVEFADHLTLIEAPQNDIRALAVIAKARELRPDKPLTAVIVTHHHFDHSGGVRAAVSEGLGVIAQKLSGAFFQTAIGRPHTIVPDALAKTPKPLKLETVDEERELKDATQTMELYHIAGSPHADTLLMAYFPRERLLVEADVFTPGAAVAPYAANLMENITKRKLQVDKIVPIHGPIAPFSELQTTIQSLPAR
jgi:glyoxylase-like metal-dependent hydrolase (beta-lactamase superfamily II)